MCKQYDAKSLASDFKARAEMLRRLAMDFVARQEELLMLADQYDQMAQKRGQ